MNKSSLFTTSITAMLFACGSALAQAPHASKNQQAMPYPPGPMSQRDMQRPPRFTPPPRPKRESMPAFPSAEQLARMAPPEPMTEEKIKERFAQRRAAVSEAMDEDRKAAEQYAEDFERLQKYRADQLTRMMDKAEERRQAMLKRIDDMEQKALERFREANAPENKASDTTAK